MGGSKNHSVVPGDTLSGLALKHYGSFHHWLLIWDVNRSAVGPNPNRIAPEVLLQIPPLSSFSATQLEETRRHNAWRNY